MERRALQSEERFKNQSVMESWAPERVEHGRR